MGRLKNNFNFVGRIGNYIAYTINGSDQIFLKSPGGPSAEMIKNKDSFAECRCNNVRWRGAVKGGQYLGAALQSVANLKDKSYASRLNSLCRSLLIAHEAETAGRGSVLFTRYGYLAENFSLNEGHFLESIVRAPIFSKIERETMEATVELPYLAPQVNLMNPFQQPYYRFVFVMHPVSDCIYNPQNQMYTNADAYNYSYARIYTPWHPFKQARQAETITFVPKQMMALEPNTSLVLSGGIEFGPEQDDSNLKIRKYSGAGKIFKLA